MNEENLKEVPVQEAPQAKEPETTAADKPQAKDTEYTLEVIRDYYGNVDPFYLSKMNPDYAYRFLRDEFKNISIKSSNLLLQRGGWQLCPKEHLLKLGIKERELSPDGFLRRGDTILAFMPKSLFEEKGKHKIDKALAPIKAIKRLVEKGDKSVGRDIHDTMKGLQTRKELGM